jgi:molybdopterin converting factor small subunit
MPTFHLPSVLSAHVGGARAVDTSGTTVGEAVEALVRRYPQLGSRLRDANGDPYPFVTFYLNDDDLRLVGGFDAAVSDGDEVTIVPAVAGG